MADAGVAIPGCPPPPRHRGCRDNCRAHGRSDAALRNRDALLARRPTRHRRAAGLVSISDDTLVVSEAGLVPLYSGWRVLDAWGLNDEEIARTGRLTTEHLQSLYPALISFHAHFSSLTPPKPTADRRPGYLGRWDSMTMELYDYAETHG